MSGRERVEALASAAEVCEHYWAWVSPAGASKSARICKFCHQPDAAWLNHVVEVDRGHGEGCVDCEFADDSPAMRDLLAEAKADAWDEGVEEGRQRWAYQRPIVEPNPYRETTTGGRDE